MRYILKKERDAVIISMGRSPIGVFGGSLSSIKAYDLASCVMKEVIQRSYNFDINILDDVIIGNCVQSPDEATIARTALLKAGFPKHIPGVTIQRQCASAMQAIRQASHEIRCNEADAILVGGVESMSTAPYILPTARWGTRLRNGVMIDSLWEILKSGSSLLESPGYLMGMTAENIAKKYNISREEQDIVALRSHNNAEEAINSGKFIDEIIPINIIGKKTNKIINIDEHVRTGITIADLEKLKPIFSKNGTVTAGNSSGINDGCAIMLILSRQKARELGCIPIARIISSSVTGCDPSMMGIGPVSAVQKLIKSMNMSINDAELIEINEAFASQYIACEQQLKIDRNITNVNGSGIALGHPVGCTGARIVITLINEMKRRNNTLGLASLCVGGGMGMAMLIENE